MFDPEMPEDNNNQNRMPDRILALSVLDPRVKSSCRRRENLPAEHHVHNLQQTVPIYLLVCKSMRQSGTKRVTWSAILHIVHITTDELDHLCGPTRPTAFIFDA